MPLDRSPANRLGLDYAAEALRLSWPGPIWDVHVHLSGVEPTRLFFDVARLFGVERVFSQTQLEEVGALQSEFGGRVEFIAIPNYAARDRADTFGADWLRRIEAFRERGARIVKFWAAPRGRDFHPTFRLDHPTRIEAMRLARSLGMMFMTHVADPDTWFASIYRDRHRYGTKPQQYEPLERLLAEFHDVKWIAAHLGGDPEHLDHLQDLLDRYPHLYLDTSATKWMVRELSKAPGEFRAFCRRNPGRLLFGSDIVVSPPGGVGAPPAEPPSFDLYASRYWALRTLLETPYDGESPIVDPDLRLLDPAAPADAAPMLRGAALDPTTLAVLYRDATRTLLPV